jgi:hypothetical protein
LIIAAVAMCGLSPTSLRAQTIRGTLLERDSDRPINLGSVTLYTEAGDSVTSTITNRLGRFELNSPDPGSFLLLGAALGHRETTVGVFELGEGGEISVEFRIPIEALPLEGFLVEADRVAEQLELNGFNLRREIGLGLFMTPADIEESHAQYTSDLLVEMQGVVLVGFDRLMIRSPIRGFCPPMIYLDGLQQLGGRVNLEDIVELQDVTAVEVYRRASEIPIQYGGPNNTACGVVLFWTKQGL